MRLIFKILPFLHLLHFTHGMSGGFNCTSLGNNAGSGTVLIDNGFFSEVQQFCTGALLSELLVLTNGNCYSANTPPMKTMVIVGTTTPFENGQIHYVIDFKFIGGSSKKYYQLALLMLNRRVLIHSYARPYALPADKDVIDKEQSYHVFGFGSTLVAPPANQIPLTDYTKNPHHEMMRNEMFPQPEGLCERIYGKIDTKDTKLFCLGRVGGVKTRLTWQDNGAPMVGWVDNVIVAMACVHYESKFPRIREQPLHYYFNIKAMRWMILAGMKELMKKNVVKEEM